MTVYVVMENHFDVARINSVFVSEALAEKQCTYLVIQNGQIELEYWK